MGSLGQGRDNVSPAGYYYIHFCSPNYTTEPHVPVFLQTKGLKIIDFRKFIQIYK